MLAGVWQLTRVTLRTDARHLGGHLTRVALGALLLWVVAIMHHDLIGVTAPGLRLFRAQLAMTHLFLTVNAIFGFSLVILEEKESGTLELVRLAGMNSLSILLGKVLPRFAESLLLLAVQVPFTLLAITLGGLGPRQVLAAYVALLAYLWITAALGVWCSVRNSSQRLAVLWAGVAILVYNLPYLVNWVGGMFTLGTSSWDAVCLPLRFWAITQSDFSGAPWGSAVLLALGVGAVMFLLAWWQLELYMTAPSAAVTSHRVMRSAKRRPWGAPLAWKEFYFLMSGGWGFLFRVGLLGLILWWMLAIQPHWGRAFAWTALLGGALGMLDGTWTASRLFADERREQTWSVLVLTPNSIPRLALEKATGWLLGYLPSFVIPLLCILLALAFHNSAGGWLERLEFLIGSLSTTIAILAYLHLLAINSLTWGWKAIPLTFTICCLGAYVVVSSIIPWNGSIEIRLVWHMGILVGLLVLIGLMQARMMQLLNHAAGEDS